MTDFIQDGAYAFDLKLLCGGYAYFLTFTGWVGSKESGREVRKPDLVNIEIFYRSLIRAGHFQDEAFSWKDLIIDSQGQYEKWLYRKGWGFISKKYARNYMSQWLKQRECLCSPLRVFTDIALVPPSTLKHYANRGIRRQVIERDKQQCLRCGAKNELTMQHVRPHSRGGETTLRNLVTLCHKCNQRCGIEFLTELYDLAGLHHDFDPSLVKKNHTDIALFEASTLSDNLMQTRCEVW